MLRALDEIDAGICDGMTYNEIKQQMPEEYAARNANKLVSITIENSVCFLASKLDSPM